jgi:hypothetical protein
MSSRNSSSKPSLNQGFHRDLAPSPRSSSPHPIRHAALIARDTVPSLLSCTPYSPAGAPVRASLRAIAIVLAILLTMLGAVGSVRCAKRHPTGAQFLASAMITVLGVGVPIVDPPQQGVEEAREDKRKKGAESGDPPAA